MIRNFIKFLTLWNLNRKLVSGVQIACRSSNEERVLRKGWNVQMGIFI